MEIPRAESDETDPPVEERSMTERVLFAFEGEEGPDRWMIVNDGVMGGLSRSRISLTEKNTAVFEGEVSLANNGGFASVRSRPEAMSTAGTSRLAVRVRGDGREYQLRIRTDDSFDGVAYRWNFMTRTDEWVTIEAPYRDFVPTFRGRTVRDFPPIDPGAIRQLGFLIADEVGGPFRLEVDWIKALE
jgi:monofunctional biosynthetic peptidoglycan transglycosylase